MKRQRFLLFFLLLPCLCLWSYDFGIILDQGISFTESSLGTDTDYTASLIPRYSTLIGDRGDIYVSAGLNLDYTDENWSFVPELLRTEFTWLFDNADFRAGRMFYSDPLGFIAEGLFDGARFSFDTMLGTFSAGAWYTGFLYKKRANISMTAGELSNYHAELDYGDFSNTYFAPSRFFAALEWEHPGLGGGFLRGRI